MKSVPFIPRSATSTLWTSGVKYQRSAVADVRGVRCLKPLSRCPSCTENTTLTGVWTLFFRNLSIQIGIREMSCHLLQQIYTGKTDTVLILFFLRKKKQHTVLERHVGSKQ